MRNLAHVIRRMLAEVPEHEEGFRGRLRSHLKSAEFAAPEMAHHWWMATGETLAAYLPGRVETLHDWQRRVVLIWVDQEGQDREAEAEAEVADPEPAEPVGSVFTFWDGKHRGVFPDLKAALADAHAFDPASPPDSATWDFYEVVGAPGECRRGGLGGTCDEHGNRVVRDCAVRPLGPGSLRGDPQRPEIPCD